MKPTQNLETEEIEYMPKGGKTKQEKTKEIKKKRNLNLPVGRLSRTVFLSERPEWLEEFRVRELVEARGKVEEFTKKRIFNEKYNTYSDCYYVVYEDVEVAKSVIEKKKVKIRSKGEGNKGRFTAFKCTKNKDELISHEDLVKEKEAVKKHEMKKALGMYTTKREFKEIKRKRFEKLVEKLKDLGRITDETPKKEVKTIVRLFKREKEKELRIQKELVQKEKARLRKEYKEKMRELTNKKKKKNRKGKSKATTPETIDFQSPNIMMISPDFINLVNLNLTPVQYGQFFNFNTPIAPLMNNPFNFGFPQEQINQVQSSEPQKKRFENAGVIEDSDVQISKPTEKIYFQSNLKRRIHFEPSNSNNLRMNWGNFLISKEARK